MDPTSIPWDAILAKGGSTVGIALAVVFARVYERLGSLSTRVSVLEALNGVKKKTDDPQI